MSGTLKELAEAARVFATRVRRDADNIDVDIRHPRLTMENHARDLERLADDIATHEQPDRYRLAWLSARKRAANFRLCGKVLARQYERQQLMDEAIGRPLRDQAERARVVAQLRFLADARKEYCHRCPASENEARELSWQQLAVHEEHNTAASLADMIEGTNNASGWLPSARWDDWVALRGTSNEPAPAVGSSLARSNDRGAVDTIEAVRRMFNHLAHVDYDGQVSMGFAATFDQHLDGMLEEAAQRYALPAREQIGRAIYEQDVDDGNMIPPNPWEDAGDIIRGAYMHAADAVLALMNGGGEA